MDKIQDGNTSYIATKGPRTFKHAAHKLHELTRYQPDEVTDVDVVCAWCGEPILSSILFACVQCRFHLHEACTFDVPDEILHIHQRQLRIYFPRNWNEDIYCFSCGDDLQNNISFMYLSPRPTGIHGRCTDLSSNFKSKNHEDHQIQKKHNHLQHLPHGPQARPPLLYDHSLIYHKTFLPGEMDVQNCHTCGKTCRSKFFCCELCELRSHLECMQPGVTHSRHKPDHKLKLVGSSKSNNEWESLSPLRLCNMCLVPLYGLSYCCIHCDDFNLHLSCARRSTSSLPEDEEEELGKYHPKQPVTFKHNAHHDHDLIRYNLEKVIEILPYELGKDITNCALCGECFLSGMIIYACLVCRVHLHEDCTFNYVPPQIKVSFHGNTLHRQFVTLDKHKHCFTCGLGLDNRIGFIYTTEDDHFGLHGHCASLSLSDFKDDYCPPSIQSSDEDVVKMDAIRHFSHDHLLSYHDILLEDAHLHACALCRDVCGNSGIFRCESCDFRLHKRCALLPQEITYSCNNGHKLKIITQKYWEKLSSCQQCLTPLFGSCYSCSQCDFNLHLGCLSLTSLSSANGKGTLRGVPKLKRGCGHSLRALISCQLDRIVEIFGQKLNIIDDGVCRWCQKGILVAGTMFYACIVCKIHPYGACTIYVPVTVLHLFHRQHPLHIRIASIKSVRYCFPCGVRHSDGITFVCGDCRDLELHGLQCSSGLLLFKSEYHHAEHNLIYIQKDDHHHHHQQEGVLSLCAKCRVPICTSDHYEGFYYCVKCKISFHISCVIQRFVEHKRHLLALQNYSTVSACCIICGEEIDRNQDLYGCEEPKCHAHIECALFIQAMQLPKSSQKRIFSIGDAVKMGPGVEASIQHRFHVHPLFYGNKIFASGFRCLLCTYPACTNDDYFYCKTCECLMHSRCLEQPEEFIHPAHPNHRLKLVGSESSNVDLPEMECKACPLPLSKLYKYCCLYCDDFNLHFVCARFADSSHQRVLKNKVPIKLPFHRHDLTLFDVDKLYQAYWVEEYSSGTYRPICSWCRRKLLSGEAYTCFSCTFFLHKACATEVVALGVISIRHPSHHPSHQLHPLHIQFYHNKFGSIMECFACGEGLQHNIGFFCEEEDCGDIGLHAHCTSLLPNLKFDEYHKEHGLTYFQKADYPTVRSRSRCRGCGYKIDSTSDTYKGFYGCVECKINFHLSCILPQTIKKHKYHSWHSLLLQNSSRDDDLCQEYYCDICELPRDPDHSFYSCEECTCFNAHIECALNQERKKDVCGYAAAIQALKVSNARKALGNHCPELTAGQILHPSHHYHALRLEDIPKMEEIPYCCKGCGLVISGPTYICTMCEDYYCLHQECADLSRHPSGSLHSLPHHPHPLALYFGYRHGKWFRCDVCGDINKKDSFNYRCLDCEFIIDFKCGALNHKDASQARRMNKLENSLFFPFHRKHRLLLGNYKNKERLHCRACVHPISGLTYCCAGCDFFLHISCIGRFPQKLELPFYSSPFELGIYKVKDASLCLVCQLPLLHSYLYYSQDYLPKPLYLHPGCSDTSLKRILAYRAHEHVLYFFGRDNHIMFEGLWQELSRMMTKDVGLDLHQEVEHPNLFGFECTECLNNCTGDFYRCIKCKVNFHLECLPIPKAVKSKWHVHQLKLKDSFDDEDYDHDDQHCDVCEEERKPEHHVYVCEECSIPFTSHIECVLHHQHQQIEERYNVEGKRRRRK